MSFSLLRQVGQRFARQTQGHPPFDFQNTLTREDITAQLPAYTCVSRRWYRMFFVMDLIFPASAACFLTLLWARLLTGPDPFAVRMRQRHAPVWPWSAAVFDLGENVCFLLLSEGAARPSGRVAMAGVAFKRLKLGSLGLTALGTLTLSLRALNRRDHATRA